MSFTGDKVFYYAQYMLELALMEYRMLKHKPSLLATGAVYLASKVLKAQPLNNLYKTHLGHSETAVKTAANDLAVLLQNIPSFKLKAIRRKFQDSKFIEVANTQLIKS